MVALGTTRPNFLDLAQETHNNQVIRTAEVLNQVNEIIPDMSWETCNDGTGHIGNVRTSLMTPRWRKLNEFVTPTKTETRQIRDGTGIMEDYSNVDEVLARMSGDVNRFREKQDRAKIESFGQEFTSTFFYGIVGSEPEAFTGVSARYASVATGAPPTSRNIITAGTRSATATSIWLIGHGPMTFHGIYPQGTDAGLQVRNKGLVTLQQNDAYMEAYQTHFRWACGIHVADWRHLVRIQYDSGETIPNAATGPNLILLMNQAMATTPTGQGGVRYAWYVNATGLFDIQQQVSQGVRNSTLQIEMQDGKRVMSYGGFPLRVCDGLRNDEQTTAPIAA